MTGGGARFGLLGPLVLADGEGGRIPLGGPRLRVLLAALLLQANTPVSWESLADTVWDGVPPQSAAGTLRSHIARLRGVLGAEAGRVVARDPGYLIRVQAGELDVLEFEEQCRRAGAALREGGWAQVSDAAARALELWRGEPLLDVPSEVLRGRFTPRLGQLRLQVREDGIEADLHLGRQERLVPQLRELTAAHPVRERFHAQLMFALARCGRRAEALEAYRQARRILVDQLGVEPGPELQELHERVLAGQLEPVAATTPARTGAPRTGAPRTGAPSAAARQLPATARHFTGRIGELGLLTGLVDAIGASGGTVVVAAIDGMAGTGKTALAVQAAHRLAGRFPDGQLFLDLHGYTRGHPPRTAAEALDFLLRSLGVPPERIPSDGERAAALYRQRLAGTSTLIVLDNAASEAQVRPLLPGGGSCLVLVTSRRHLKALDDAHLVSLGMLSPQDAVALLRAVAGLDRIAADDPLWGEVAGLCGYLPLALRIAGALLRHRPAWGLEQLAGQLRDQRRRVSALSDGERELPAVFDLSYAGLAEEHRRLWRRLGLIPGPELDACAAAALAEVDPAGAAGLLEDLVDHNLLGVYAPGRYRLHDLLRAHARTLAAADPAPEREAAVDRLLHYYAHTAQSASILVARYPRPRPDGPPPARIPALSTPEAARTWLRTELPDLEAAFAHAHARGLHDQAIALAAGLAEILQTDGPWTRALHIHRAAAEAAERSGRPAALAIALTDLGRVRHQTGDYPGAADTHARALELYRASGDRLGEANALNDLGRVRFLTGDYPEAADTHTRALELYRASGSRLGEAIALTDLGRVRCQTGDYPGAADALHRGLELYRALGHRLGEAIALTELGRVRSLIGDYPEAGRAHARALELYRTIGHRNGEANALNDLGRARSLAGDHPGACDAYARALELYRELGHRLGEAVALTNLGQARSATGDHPGADDALTQALDLFRALGNRGNAAWALNHYAAALAASGQRPRALALYREALAVHRELNKPDDEAVSLEGIAEHHLANGDPARGAARLRQALEIYQRLGMAPDTRRLRGRLDGIGVTARP